MARQISANRESKAHTLAELERLRVLIQAVVDDNRQLLRSPGQQVSAHWRIAEVEPQMQELDREISDLRRGRRRVRAAP